MHIKTLTVRGFRTYKDEAKVSLSPHYNVIVGLNGSGKSNILLAVAFILNSDLGNLAKERKIYLHEGMSTRVTTAFVEIVFDNSDRRLSMFDQDEVVIKRVFSAKKDDWLIDGKHVNKNEFIQIMESAGFSRSNPYYIVRQGKISELATMSDISRMKLLRDISGTKTYDERRNESVQMLIETNKKRKAAEELLNSIAKKFDSLKEEQEELRLYRECTRNKKDIEYFLNELSWKESFDKEVEFEKQYNSCVEKSSELDKQIQHEIMNMESAKINQKQLEDEIRQMKRRREDINEQFIHAQSNLIGISLDLNNLLNEVNETEKNKKNLQISKLQIENEIKEIEEKLECDAEQNYFKAKNEFEKIKEIKIETEKQLTRVCTANIRLDKCKSFEERNEILKKEIQKKKNEISAENKKLLERSAKIEELSKLLVLKKEKLTENQQKKENNCGHLELLNEEHKKIYQELEDLVQRSHEIRSELNESQKIQHRYQDLLKESEDKFWKSVNYSNRVALKSAQQWMSEKGSSNSQICGMLIENIKVAEEYRSAVESIGGNQLYNYLVDDDSVANDLINYIRNNKKGRILVCPLKEAKERIFIGKSCPLANQSKGEKKNPHESSEYENLVDNEDCIPLVELIEYDKRVEAAVYQVWGNAMLVRDLNVADKLNFRERKVDAVNLNGDVYSRNGILSGGFCRAQQMRLNLFYQMKDNSKQCEDLAKEVENLNNKLAQMENKIRNLEENLADLNDKKFFYLNEIKILTETILLLQIEIDKKTAQKEALSEQKEENAKTIIIMNSDLKIMQNEMNLEDFGDTQGENKIKSLQNEFKKICTTADMKQNEFIEAQTKMIEMKGSLKSLKNKLNHIVSELSNFEWTEDEEKRREKQIMKTQLEAKIKYLTEEKDSLDQRITILNEQNSAYLEKIETILVSVNDLHKKLSECTRLMQYYKQQQEYFYRIKEEANNKRLTLPPPDESARANGFERFNKTALLKENSKIEAKLSSFQNVNKKAIDQFASYIDDQEYLQNRKIELDESQKAIIKLIEKLDEQKEETLISAFRKINTRFGEIFSEIIPTGKAKLVLKKLSAEEIDFQSKELEKIRKIEQIEEAEESMDELSSRMNKLIHPKKVIESIIGISINVSFTGADQSYYTMQQLSGGQKTVVALALILAIQRCDPAPFYLFDEIDAALDDQYRTQIANLIERHSRTGAQFLITTFRPQLIEAADRFFLVTMRNRCSAIQNVTKTVAFSTIQEQLALEEE